MARRALLRANAGAVMTTSASFTLKYGAADELDWQGGNGALFVVGTWNGATAKLQILAPDGTTWLDVGTGVTMTADGVGGFIAPAGSLRVNIASAGASTSLKAWVAGIPTNNAG